MRPAVFLDRDGTLIEDVGYLDRLERLRLYPWTIDAMCLMSRAGYAVVVVTNQAGVALGLLDEPFVREVHAVLQRQLAAVGGRLDGHYYCPHHPDASIAAYRRHCDCRKPKPGMVHRAAADLGLDLTRSVVVGDRWLDLQLAAAVGAKGILVKTGYGASQARQPPDGATADAIVNNVIEAAVWILEHGPVASEAAPQTDEKKPSR